MCIFAFIISLTSCAGFKVPCSGADPAVGRQSLDEIHSRPAYNIYSPGDFKPF